jgi:deoxyribodipyrimidine photo-lyase
VNPDGPPGPGLPAACPRPPGSGAGEHAAWARWVAFRDGALAAYHEGRDRPDLEGTSRLSEALKLGELHPRSLLTDLARSPLAGSPGAQAFTTELAWREFYADVLWQHPTSAWSDLRPIPGMTYDEPGPGWHAWRAGATGYPFVAAGMRQLLATGWMHNRVRMVTASFLVKDLHVWWPHGARHFMAHLADADLASNSHGWQWVSGTGTDAAPYPRIFNPVTQGQRFDPHGDYVRRWVPELAELPGAAVHQPWAHPLGYAAGYPPRILDHATERAEALRRFGRRG